MQDPSSPPGPPSGAAPDRIAADAADAPAPPGFRPLRTAGDFVQVNGPLYLYHQGDDVRLGFRVEKRHTNPMGICHGGMLASFCDMLLPISAHRVNREVGQRFLPTINLQIDYLASAKIGDWVEGRAEVLKVTRSLVFAQGLATANGVPCTRVSGIFKLGPPFRPDMEASG